jgi:methyl-accepting chemotaxis protein
MTWVLETVFKPAAIIMNRLRYGKKFLLITLLFLSVISLMMYDLVKEIHADRTFASKERLGVQYNQTLFTVLLDFQQHRGIANGLLNGDEAQKKVLADKEAQMVKTIESMDAVDAALGDQLQSAAKWNALKAKWQELQTKTPSLKPAESFEQHSLLIEDTLALITHVGDTSNLILDPDLDSYYLMDLTIQKLPLLSEKIGQTRGQGNGMAARKRVTADEKLQMMIYMNDMKANINGVTKGIATAGAHNEVLKSKLDSLAQDNVKAANLFHETLTTRLVNAAVIDIPPTELFGQGTKALDATNVLYKAVTVNLDQLLEARIQKLTSKLYGVITFNVLVLVLAAYMFVGFYVSVRKTIFALKAASAEMASGNLLVEAELTTRDELREVGDAFNAMTARIRTLIRSNKELAEQVSYSSKELTIIAEQTAHTVGEIAESMQQIASGSEQQSRGAEETANAMTEMAIGIGRIAENAGTVAEVSVEASRLADAGSESLGRAVEQMRLIRQTVQESAGKVRTLGSKSEEIGQIISAITDIAARTNLLALNASIEAARAGEQGKGFAVVAGEIRKLAEQTKSSADMITEMIEEVQTTTQEAQHAMIEGVDEVEKGAGAISDTSELFGSILAAVDRVAQEIQEVSAASQEMAAGSQQVTASIDEMLQIARRTTAQTQEISAATEEQTASVEEITASAESLSQAAAKLSSDIEKFKV